LRESRDRLIVGHVDLLGPDRLVIGLAERVRVATGHHNLRAGLCAWVDELAAQHQVVLDPVLRTRSPRTAAQLAAAGMGVTIVPASALPAKPAGVVRSFAPRIRREVVVVVASTSDALAMRFVADLRRRGLPD